MAEESINLKEAIQIAKIIMVVPEERMPIIQEVFSKAGVDIETLSKVEEFKVLMGEDIDTLAGLLEIVTNGKQAASGVYRIDPQEFNQVCKDNELNPAQIKSQLASLNLIRQSSWKGGHTVTACTVREDGRPVRRICVYEDWMQRIESN